MNADKHLGLLIGIVSKREDDGKLGRVKVTFPTLDNRESDWIRCLSPFAGSDGGAHGHVWVPREKEEVVVGFLNGDPKTPIILGSLYSKKQPPPWTEIDERGFQTPQGHYLKVSDKDDFFEVRTKGGQVLKIDDKNKKIELKGVQEIVVDAPQTITIKAQNATVESTTTTIKATSATIDAQSISLGSGAIEPAILGLKFMTDWQTHTHLNGNMGSPTGPPIQPLTCLSTVTKLSK